MDAWSLSDRLTHPTVGLQTGSHVRYPHTNWAGLCVDSGAEQTVVGLNEAWAYSTCAQLPWHLRPSPGVFRFGDNVTKSEGIMKIRILVRGHGFLMLDGHVVRADAPLLLGLDVLRLCRLTLDFRKIFIASTNPPWELPLTYAVSHALVSRDALTGALKDASRPYSTEGIPAIMAQVCRGGVATSPSVPYTAS